MAKQRPRKFHILALIPVLALALLAVYLCCAPFPRLEVGGFRITREEYLRAMYQARNDVLSDHAAAGISLRDWSAETELGDPCQLAAERAIELLKEYYAVGTLAVEQGYLADAGYDAMLRDMAEINRKRREALDSGEMVTGLPQFTVEDYLTYRAASLRLQFCNDPATEVTQEELQARYEADRDNLYRQPDSMELVFLSLTAPAEELDALEQELLLLRQKALEKGGLAPALEELPRLKADCQVLSVTPDSYGVYARSHGDILAAAAELQTGELSRVLRREDWLCLIQCTQRTVHGYAPLVEVQSVVAQSIRESRYDALITQRAQEMEVTGNLRALYRFTGEQLT